MNTEPGARGATPDQSRYPQAALRMTEKSHGSPDR
jgi:hypothetical protein